MNTKKFAFIGSVALTLAGLSQTYLYKWSSSESVILWFPAAVIIKQLTNNEFAMLMIAAVQFTSLLALHFRLLRWVSVFTAWTILVVVYGSLVGVAFLLT